MLEQILKAFLVGITVSLPLGPIAVLTIRNSLDRGHGAGFVTGLGACVTDTMWSLLAIFALAAVQKFVDEYVAAIAIFGGLVVLAVGIKMVFSNPFKRIREDIKGAPSVKDFLQAILLGLMNPGSMLIIMAMFAFLGLQNIPTMDWKVAPIIIAISCGSATYWFSITKILSLFRNKFSLGMLIWTNRVAGMIVIILALICIGDGLFKIVFQGVPLF